jgi:hypothetical protein
MIAPTGIESDTARLRDTTPDDEMEPNQKRQPPFCRPSRLVFPRVGVPIVGHLVGLTAREIIEQGHRERGARKGCRFLRFQ